ncbi:aminoglycoside phosphotransferase family protein [Actinopolymorpha sp. B9G3]|uniref:phosphotransferase enzyme family protein n=1 Tax=Actinopolymorpha sp. B9G3 TaxID=3158970 RepID=UPI0032D9912A
MPQGDRAPEGSLPPSSPPLMRSTPVDALDPHLRQLTAEIAPGSTATDLGGWMSRNLLLEPAGIVLRVHPPYVTRRRLLAVQHVRQTLAGTGIRVPVAVSRDGATTFRCGDRWAETERHIPHETPPSTWQSYAWMFRAMGTLHRRLAAVDLRGPRPSTAIFAAPSTLWAWLPTTEEAVAGDAESARIGRSLRSLLGRLRYRWVSPTGLPRQLVHGDVKLENLGIGPSGETVFLDFGFVTHRPRIHDLAFSLTHSVLTVDGHVPTDPTVFPWHRVGRLVEEYEKSTGAPLTILERRALAPYTAAARIYHATYAGFGPNPAEWLHNNVPAIQFSDWLLEHPEVLGS